MVIEESLRMFPAAHRVERVCNQDYEFDGIKIKQGQLLIVSINSLHYDEELYPNPEKFDPERFNETNRKTRDQVTHMPFGAGKRKNKNGQNKIKIKRNL
jgi:cytochrome P450